MKKTLIAAGGAVLLGLAPASAMAQAPAAAAQRYTTADTTIGTLLEDPAAKAIVDKHFPGLSTADSIQMASGMTMKQLQQFKPELFTDASLTATDADLAKLPAKK